MYYVKMGEAGQFDGQRASQGMSFRPSEHSVLEDYG